MLQRLGSSLVQHYGAKLSELIGLIPAERYGAKGDGVTDDTASIQACLDAHRNVLLLPGKTYICNGIKTTVDDITIIGGGSVGAMRTRLLATKACDAVLNIGGTVPHSVRERIKLKGFCVDGGGVATLGIDTCASISPEFITDIRVENAKLHGLVHRRGWSTFARGLTCINNGGGGLRLEGDNNNTHWEGLWGHNKGIGVYVKNAACVTFKGSVENNGEEGAVVTATQDITPNFVNVVTSDIDFSGCYFEGNGQNEKGRYAEISLGGGSGLVRETKLTCNHIGLLDGGIGIQVNQKVSGVNLDFSGIYQVTGRPTASILFSSAYSDVGKVIATGVTSNGLNISGPVVTQGFDDTTGVITSFIAGGGICNKSKSLNAYRVMQVTGENRQGTAKWQAYRDNELIAEFGCEPNTTAVVHAPHASGSISFKVQGVEKMKINRNGVTFAELDAIKQRLSALEQKMKESSASSA